MALQGLYPGKRTDAAQESEMTSETTHNSDTERAIRLRKLKFRSWHRGITEMDLILGHFAASTLDSLSDAELDTYEQLIEIEDTALYNLRTGRENGSPAHAHEPVARRKTFTH